jgi:hypothetical protein
MESKYDNKAWSRETELGRRIFNYNFRMLGREVRGWELLKVVPMHTDRALSEMTYLWQNKNAPKRELVRINVSELLDWRAAQKHFLGILQHSMRPDIPRGTGTLAALGDIEFVAKAAQSDIPAAIQFTRGNIAVAANSVGSVSIDVSDIAFIVDRMLIEPPIRIPSLRKYAKQISPRRVRTRGTDEAALIKDVKFAGNAWLKVIVPDGELRRRDGAIEYMTKQLGSKSVQIFLIRAGKDLRTNR